MGSKLPDLIRGLHPESIQWLIDKNYLTKAIEDGVTVLQVTSSGYHYFGSIGALHEQEPKTDGKSGIKTPE